MSCGIVAWKDLLVLPGFFVNSFTTISSILNLVCIHICSFMFILLNSGSTQPINKSVIFCARFGLGPALSPGRTATLGIVLLSDAGGTMTAPAVGSLVGAAWAAGASFGCSFTSSVGGSGSSITATGGFSCSCS